MILSDDLSLEDSTLATRFGRTNTLQAYSFLDVRELEMLKLAASIYSQYTQASAFLFTTILLNFALQDVIDCYAFKADDCLLALMYQYNEA